MMGSRFDRFVRCSAAITIALLMVSAPAQANEQEALRERVAELSSIQNPMVDGAPIATIHGINKLYELRSWEPVWTDSSMIRQLYDHVLRSVEHGLNPDDFHAHQLGARLDAGPGSNVDERGTVSFYKDVYSRDARIIRGLDQPFRIDPPEGAREAVVGRVSP